MKQLKARMAKERQRQREAVKAILYPLPDLKGPQGNAFALLGHAQALMKEAKIGDDQISLFMQEAKSGDYDHLLHTIAEWFTLCVPVTNYVPIEPKDFAGLVKQMRESEDIVDPDAEAQVELEKQATEELVSEQIASGWATKEEVEASHGITAIADATKEA